VAGRPIKFGYPGSSDIIGVYKGRFLAIEVKRRKGVRKKEQIAFQRIITESGGIAIFAECVEDVQKII